MAAEQVLCRVRSFFALLLCVGVALTGLLASAQMSNDSCDQDNDGLIDSQEASNCAEAWFDEVASGTEIVSREDFLSILGDEFGDPEDLVGDIDADGDGQITRQEWLAWHEAAFAEATGADYVLSLEAYRAEICCAN